MLMLKHTTIYAAAAAAAIGVIIPRGGYSDHLYFRYRATTLEYHRWCTYTPVLATQSSAHMCVCEET